MPLKDDYLHQILHIQFQYKKYIEADHMVPPGVLCATRRCRPGNYIMSSYEQLENTLNCCQGYYSPTLESVWTTHISGH